MIFGDGWAASDPLDVDRLAPLVVDAHDLGAVPAGDVDHALAEEAVDGDDDDVAGRDGVDEGGLHAGRPGGRERQGAPVVGAPDVAEQVARLVHDRRGSRGRGGPSSGAARARVASG